MNNRAKVAAVLGAASLAAAVVVPLVLAGRMSAESAAGAAASPVDVIPVCGRAADASGPAFYAEVTSANAQMHEGMEIARSGNVDRDFMRMMIPHHQGAIDMALVLLKYGRDEKIRRLAQSIIVEQGQEIAYLRTLLDAPPGETSATRGVADQ
jgi:hypothetical protein